MTGGRAQYLQRLASQVAACACVLAARLLPLLMTHPPSFLKVHPAVSPLSLSLRRVILLVLGRAGDSGERD